MEAVFAFLADMPFWAWLGLAALFLVAEIATGTMFLLWPALAAFLLGLITTVQLDGKWATQWILFAVLTVALGLVGRPYAERWINQGASDRPKLNKLAERKAGKIGAAASDFVAGQGRVQLGDTEWQGKLADNTSAVRLGDPVEVIEMDGTILVVAPIAKNQ